MGDKPSKYDEPLQPQPTPFWAIDPKFCVNREVTLLLKEKLFSWSGDDFEIKDPTTGQTWFRMAGKAFSLREKKTLSDSSGVPILNIKETLLSLMEPNYRVYLGESSEEEIFKVVAHVTFGKAKMHTTISNRQTNTPVLVTLKGNILMHEAVIYIGEAKQGGLPIAKIHRSFTAREYMSGKQEYCLTVAPNVDISMMVAICICLDEMKKDH